MWSSLRSKSSSWSLSTSSGCEKSSKKHVAVHLSSSCSTRYTLLTTANVAQRQHRPSQWAFPFNAPVDTNKYKDYLSYVSQPMDLGTIKGRLESSSYTHPDQIHADVKLVFANVRKYNPAGSDVVTMGNALESKFEERWAATVVPKVGDEKINVANAEMLAKKRILEGQQQQVCIPVLLGLKDCNYHHCNYNHAIASALLQFVHGATPFVWDPITLPSDPRAAGAPASTAAPAPARARHPRRRRQEPRSRRLCPPLPRGKELRHPPAGSAPPRAL